MRKNGCCFEATYGVDVSYRAKQHLTQPTYHITHCQRC
ncbi:hypothetical protein T4C_11108 [Trichinella pseudospiralis]|uniref:Uncharacterized protein n=1 Tax=Trichinella pseudospiralis TaxID=6337 RepID=A0A0V1GFW8_TRIPS|nr:hypothetical protein T4C_11108 [Trichinella pseudospiralis]